jgi:hypothetical protein
MSDFDPKITLNLGDTIPFLWEKMLGVIGKDSGTVALKEWFTTLQQSGFATASSVQCIGMHTPLPLQDIYRPTKLLWQTAHLVTQTGLGRRLEISLPTTSVTPNSFLSIDSSATIKAGPGWGKTTLLHYLFLTHLKSEKFVPVLITLRHLGSIDHLERLINTLGEIKKIKKGLSILLLVDGYDEIPLISRKRVSELLLKFMAVGVGRLYITCRDFYEIIDLNLPVVKVAPFDEVDQKQYVASFTAAYGSRVNAETMLAELRDRGLTDLLEHPLLLALVCIVKSGSMSLYSRSVLVLIERALETLSFRWDEGKGIAREQRSPLDGRARIHCLMRIAFNSKSPNMSDRIVMQFAREQLDMLRWDQLDERQVMMETARFYGILVPIDEERWQFVHKTLHDYLAARYMVERGLFEPKALKTWDSRSAYAACLSPDATQSMLSALVQKDSFPAFVEMLSNDAPFEHAIIAHALIRHFESFPKIHFYEKSEPNRISVQLTADFISLASTKFLQDLAFACSASRSKARDTFLAYAIAELGDRGQKITVTTFSQMSRNLGTDFKFTVHHWGGWKTICVAQLAPD